MEIAPGIYQINTSKMSNCFLIADPVPTLVDSGTPMGAGKIATYLSGLSLSLNDVRRLILTHHDIDHIGSAQELRRVTGMEVYLHPLDLPYVLGEKRRKPLVKVLLAAVFGRRMRYGPPRATLPLENGQILEGIHVIHTPGHTPGHVCLLHSGVLFCGDAIVTGEKFRISPRLLTQDPSAARQSVRKLLDYDFDTAVSGHGKPATGAKAKMERLVRSL